MTEIKVHYLKTWPEFFNAVIEPDPSKRKTVEIRKNDRDFKVGDALVLMEYDPVTEQYTDRQRVVVVTHILSGQPWLPDGYVAMSILLLEADEEDAA